MQCRARGRRRVRSRQRVLLRPRLRVLLIRVLLLLLLLLLEHLFCGELRQPSRQRARQRGVLVVGMDLGVAAARWFIFDALIDATIPPGDPYPDPYAPDDPCPAFAVNDETALVNPPALGVANDPDALVLG
jgi:hypothetical protein